MNYTIKFDVDDYYDPNDIFDAIVEMIETDPVQDFLGVKRMEAGINQWSRPSQEFAIDLQVIVNTEDVNKVSEEILSLVSGDSRVTSVEVDDTYLY